MLVTAISGILMIGIAALVNSSSSQNESLKQKIRLEQDMYQLAFFLKHNLSLAVNLEFIEAGDMAQEDFNVAKSINGGEFTENTGKLISYNSEDFFDASASEASVDTIAYFFRDTLNSDNPLITDPATSPSGTDRFKRTGLFFQKPTPTTFGIIYLNLGEGDDTVVSPTPESLRFDGIISLKIIEPEFTIFDPRDPDLAIDTDTNINFRRLASVTFKITQRQYFSSSVAFKNHKWCPPASMSEPECSVNDQYKDIERVIRIVFRNNVIGFSSLQADSYDSAFLDGNEESRFPPPDSLIPRPRIVPRFKTAFESLYFLKGSYPISLLKR
jgi:hypothetical protein